jgi:S-DNA-T family DNA segregation ATPase FtsK/SpoIIIE
MTDLTIVDGAPPELEPIQPVAQPSWVARLSATTGPAAGQAYEIQPGRWKLGRSPREEAGFQLVAVPDPGMSRDHFALEAGLAAVILRDLGSTNGTRVNGAKVERHMLAEGEVVQCGQTAFRVQLALRSPP